MKCSSEHAISKLWTIGGTVIIAIGLCITVALWGKEIMMTVEDSAGMTTANPVNAGIIGLGFIPFGLFCLLVPKFVSGVNSYVHKGEDNYPISAKKTPREKLLNEAVALQTIPGTNLHLEVYGNWIDVSDNWQNSLSLLNGVTKRINVYKKMFYINDDYTYQELDCEYEAEANINLGTLSASRRIAFGHIKHHSVQYLVGANLNNKEVGINKYTLDTLDITNNAHRWLADHGYRRID
jgi:hypothetical protein